MILPPADPALGAAVLTRLDVTPGTYVLVVPGGGTGHPGAADAVARFHAAAAEVAATGIATLFAGPRLEQPVSSLRQLGSLPQAELAELMRGARLIIANGGSTLLQAIACGAATVAVAIADDQGERIRRCVAAGV